METEKTRVIITKGIVKFPDNSLVFQSLVLKCMRDYLGKPTVILLLIRK